MQHLRMNAPNTIPLHLIGRVEAALEKEAVENLTTRLLEGEQVGKFNLEELLDCELSGIPTYDKRFPEIAALLHADPKELPALVDKLKLGLVQRYLDSHIDLVHDEMYRLEEPVDAT